MSCCKLVRAFAVVVAMAAMVSVLWLINPARAEDEKKPGQEQGQQAQLGGAAGALYRLSPVRRSAADAFRQRRGVYLQRVRSRLHPLGD